MPGAGRKQYHSINLLSFSFSKGDVLFLYFSVPHGVFLELVSGLNM